MHISACTLLRTLLEGLRKRMLFIALLDEVALVILQHSSREYTSEGIVGMPIDNREYIASSAGMSECRGEELMKYLVSFNALRIYDPLIIFSNGSLLCLFVIVRPGLTLHKDESVFLSSLLSFELFLFLSV
jgi:hypothetical protein